METAASGAGPADLRASGHKTMTVQQPEGPGVEGVQSLEVRWILPGRLETTMTEWFGRFPAALESREDSYLRDPRMRGLSVKIRGGRAFEVKLYRGSPGALDVAGRAHGRMESWQKWSFPVDRPGPGTAAPASWLPVRKRRRIIRFPPAGGRGQAGLPEPGDRRGCGVELTEIGMGGKDWWSLGFEAAGPAAPACCAGTSRPPPRSCSPLTCPRPGNSARMTPGLTRSGLAASSVPEVMQMPERWSWPGRRPRATGTAI